MITTPNVIKIVTIKLGKQSLSTNYLFVNINYREKLGGDNGFSGAPSTKDVRR